MYSPIHDGIDKSVPIGAVFANTATREPRWTGPLLLGTQNSR
jgi:hypothetical protein